MEHPVDHVPEPVEGGQTPPASDLSFRFVLAVPICAGLGTVGPLAIAGFNFTGVMWFFFLLVGAFILFAEKAGRADSRIYFPGKVWLVWCGYLVLSLVWCDPLDDRNIQDAVQIGMPLLVGAIASQVVRTREQLARLLGVFTPTLFLLCLPPVAHVLGVLRPLGMNVAERPLALAAALVGCVFLARWPGQKFVPLLGWGMCVLLTVVTGSRMAALALLLAPILHPLVRSWLWPVGALLGTAALGVALFYTPIFQERFFYEGSGTLGDLFEGNFLSFGRFEAWPDIWAEAWRRPFFGAGVGYAYGFVPTVWDGMTYAHNDYLRVGLELGLVGLALFLGSLVWQLWDLRGRIRRSQGALRTAYAASWLGLVLFMITAFTDNTLSYNLWYMNPLFALLGAAYGVDGRACKNQGPVMKV
jgi:O-antigen ligase